MKRIILILTILVLCLTACQATYLKEESKLSTPVPTPAPEPDTTAKPLNFPETYKESRSYYGGKLTIDIDAHVEYPKDGELCIYQVSDCPIDQDIAEAIITYFCKDTPIYSSSRPLTKAELQADLIDYKAKLKDNEESSEYQEQTIQMMEDMILTAPNKVIHKELDLTQPHVFGEADLGKAYKASVVINQDACYMVFHDGSGSCSHYGCDKRGHQDTPDGVITYSQEDEREAPPLKVTVEDAVDEAYKFLKAVGLEGYHFRQWETGIRILEEGKCLDDQLCRMLYFTKDLGNIPISSDHGRSFGLSRGGGMYNDKICISVDDQGIFDFVWENCGKINGLPQTNLPHKDFDSVIDSFFEEMSASRDTMQGDDSVLDANIVITHIRLEHVKVSDLTPMQTSSYIPVWSFYGNVTGRHYEKSGRIAVYEVDREGIRHAFYCTYAVDNENGDDEVES